MEQRLRYADWFFVWAKDRTSMPRRMASLVDEFHFSIYSYATSDAVWSRNAPGIDMFDVFEPSFLDAALKSDLNLGHLIFGSESWVAYGGTQSQYDDPLTALYREHVNLSPKRHLQLGSRFKNIITQSLGVSIGPLEFCGIGHIVYIGPTAHIALCKGDPVIPQFHEDRSLRGRDRISSHLDMTGKRKRARTDKENRALSTKLKKIDAGYVRAGIVDEGKLSTRNEEGEPKPKKRRLSADQKLALTQQNV
ncbi:hypothetical protein R3P38DRAFT_2806467 [Favolaschia claudopus]|uniref:Uncharacterized protein n=1 Tax=Favolaschia claudopus TaxID=2862362 RepID=A0AAV9ZJR1_9AGAR